MQGVRHRLYTCQNNQSLSLCLIDNPTNLDSTNLQPSALPPSNFLGLLASIYIHLCDTSSLRLQPPNTHRRLRERLEHQPNNAPNNHRAQIRQVQHPQYLSSSIIIILPCLTCRSQNLRRPDVFGDKNANPGVSARMHSRRDTHIQYLLPHPSLNLPPIQTVLLLPSPFLPHPATSIFGPPKLLICPLQSPLCSVTV